ncbi:hypothetical protein EBB79_05510 [Parasedimentitalea marina]|uniref:Uncharacterized protein n=1 Tax=Parasedimentitalea marina TaxID=2483033 RepID=A0A3T0N073_9RHOB|nr:hypothetical protein [Parasedimentitalea marina]AZV77401.1 hypothetical protein EBB79_05510 [Parasedimentitalea marina]
MNQVTQARGGATVGVLSELTSVEATAVRHLRQWFTTPETRLEMRDDVTKALGPDLSDIAIETFGKLCMLCVQHGRRPLVRHGMTCSCLGADENCFANMIAAAADGQIEDTLMFASLIVRPSRARELLPLASQFGHLLRQMTTSVPPSAVQSPVLNTLH